MVRDGLLEEVTFKGKSQIQKVQGQGGLHTKDKQRRWCGSAKITGYARNRKGQRNWSDFGGTNRRAPP